MLEPPRLSVLPVLLSVFLFGPTVAFGQPSDQARNRGRTMLEQIKEDLEEYYYDPEFRGVDLEAEYQEALEKIETAPSLTHIFGILAQFTLNLEDSHTVFIPPARVKQIDYGFDMGFVGDTCFVTRVQEGSSAEEAGLERGDALLALGPFQVTRQNFDVIEYIFYVLSPQQRVWAMIQKPNGEGRRLEFEARAVDLPFRVDLADPNIINILREGVRAISDEEDHVWTELIDVMLWKMPSFTESRDLVDDMMEWARDYRALVLDLRGNRGGYVKTERRLISWLFDEEIFVGEIQTRDGLKEVHVEPRDEPFQGKLVVLVDAQTASAAEIVARTVQLQGRGTVVGDRTAGAVMTSIGKSHKVGFSSYWRYATRVSVSDYIMPDGGRLEGRGVIPDEIVRPTGADLRDGRDPALARALELVGNQMAPEAAARVFGG